MLNLKVKDRIFQSSDSCNQTVLAVTKATFPTVHPKSLPVKMADRMQVDLHAEVNQQTININC